MSQLKWNDGMSVGVDSIDDDHKGLLSLINQLSNAVNANETEGVIDDIFLKLENYIRQHFSREESMMEQCGYNDLEAHRRQHQKFIDKIPELRSHLLTAENIEVAQEASLFLVNWLMNHIVIDDMSYAKTLHDNGLSTVKDRPETFFQRICHWLEKSIVLDKRIFLGMLVPVVWLAMMSVVVFWDYYQHHTSLLRQQSFANLIAEIHTFSHSLQVERRLSMEYAGAQAQLDLSALDEARSASNKHADSFHQFLSSAIGMDGEGRHYPGGNPVDWFDELVTLRREINGRLITAIEIQQFFSSYIDRLISIFQLEVQSRSGADAIKNLTALAAIINLKEVTELTRVTGKRAFAQHSGREGDRREFVRLIGKQDVHLRAYRQAVIGTGYESRQMLDIDRKYSDMRRIERAMSRALVTGDLSAVEVEQWFETVAAAIDSMSMIIDGLLLDTVADSERKRTDFESKFILLAVALFIFVVSSFLISWLLSSSIVTPIHRLTGAMKRMSEGYRDVRFNDDLTDDEIGDLFHAYEYTRRKLLQVDILTATRFERQSVSIEQKEREKEAYLLLASTDALTGAVNRRRYNEIAEQELKRVQRYRHGLSLMMLDIDHFKSINDTYGHAGGDFVLKSFYECCFKCVRETDVVARIGGEEFSILMPETNLQAAIESAQRICVEVSELEVKIDDRTVRLTVSIGVCEWSDNIHNIDSFLELADKALYQAKEDGRNRVVNAN